MKVSIWTFFWILYIPCIIFAFAFKDKKFSVCMIVLTGMFMSSPIIVWESLGKPFGIVGGLLSIIAGMMLLWGLISLLKKVKESANMKKKILYLLAATLCLFIFSIFYCPPHQLDMVQKETDSGTVWVDKQQGFEYTQKEAEIKLGCHKWISQECLFEQLNTKYFHKNVVIPITTSYGTYCVGYNSGRRHISASKDNEGIIRYRDYSPLNSSEEVCQNEYLRNYGKPPVEGGDIIPPHKPYKPTPYYDSGLADELDKIEMENKIRRLETEVDYLNSQISAYGY